MGERLIVIGGGNMARALILGAIARQSATPSTFVVCEPDRARREAFRSGVFVGRVERAEATIGEAMRGAAPQDQALLAVKPQALPEVARELAPLLGGGRRVVITILAGTASARVRTALGGACAVVRGMPNLPASVGRGAAAIALGAGAVAGDDALALELFSGSGEVVRIEERMMDAFTALAGSGPAYVFYLAEAMERAAREMGFGEDVADRVVRAVVAGSGEMLARAESGAAELRAAVTSKGGTTEAGVRVLDQEGVMSAIVRAIVAARDRGAELDART